MAYRNGAYAWRDGGARSLPTRYDRDPYSKRPQYDEYGPHNYEEPQRDSRRPRREDRLCPRAVTKVVAPAIIFILVLASIAIGGAALYYALNDPVYEAGFEMDMKLPLSKYSEKLKSPTDPLFVSSEATFCNAVKGAFSHRFYKIDVIACSVIKFSQGVNNSLVVRSRVYMNTLQFEDAKRRIGAPFSPLAQQVIVIILANAVKDNPYFQKAELENITLLNDTYFYGVILTLSGEAYDERYELRTSTVYSKVENNICDAMKTTFGDLFTQCIVTGYRSGSLVADVLLILHTRKVWDATKAAGTLPTEQTTREQLGRMLIAARVSGSFLKESVSSITADGMATTTTTTTTATTMTTTPAATTAATG